VKYVISRLCLLLCKDRQYDYRVHSTLGWKNATSIKNKSFNDETFDMKKLLIWKVLMKTECEAVYSSFVRLEKAAFNFFESYI
jgi:hypothetical protein